MSVRAYRVNKLEWENRATFNLWHDKEIIEWLENNTSFYDGLNSDCSSGITELSISDIERMIKDLNLDEDQIELLKKDIEFAKKNGYTYVQYYIF